MSLVKSIGKQKVNVDFNKDFINLFSQKIKSNDVAFINQTLEDLHAADVADLIENLLIPILSVIKKEISKRILLCSPKRLLHFISFP